MMLKNVISNIFNPIIAKCAKCGWKKFYITDCIITPSKCPKCGGKVIITQGLKSKSNKFK